MDPGHPLWSRVDQSCGFIWVWLEEKTEISRGSYKLAIGEHLGVTDAGGFCACLQLDV